MSTRNVRRNVKVRIQSPAPTDNRPAGTYRDLESGMLVMLPIRGWATGLGLPCDLEFLVDLDPRRDRPQFVMVELTLTARDADQIGTHILRASLNLPELVATAVSLAMSPDVVTEATPHAQPIERARGLVYVAGEHQGSRPKIRDDELDKVLEVCEKKGGLGGGGTDAVKNRWGVDRTTAWRTIKRAQARARKGGK